MNSRVIEINNSEVEILQDLAFGYAGEVWDGALVLAHFMINKNKKHKVSFENKVILELGSGTGAVGIIASLLNAKKVYLTDKAENLEILNRNIEKNKEIISKSGCEIEVIALDWNKKEDWANVTDKIDMIICSEVVWNPEHFNPLVDVLDYFCIENYTEVLLGYQYRKKSDLDFFNILKNEKKYSIERIPESWMDDEYKADDIFILMIRK